MKITVSIITDRCSSYVPREVLEPSPTKEVWLEDRWEEKPPTPCLAVLTHGDKLGVDFTHIDLVVGDAVDYVPHNVLKLGSLNLYINEVDKEYCHIPEDPRYAIWFKENYSPQRDPNKILLLNLKDDKEGV
jgi:hypothetical protein